MRYLKRLKGELQDLTEKLAPSAMPKYVRVRDTQRQRALAIIIVLIKKARSIDQLMDSWVEDESGSWQTYLLNLEHWLGQMPEAERKPSGNDKAAA
jgi:hypothetical protein